MTKFLVLLEILCTVQIVSSVADFHKLNAIQSEVPDIIQKDTVRDLIKRKIGDRINDFVVEVNSSLFKTHHLSFSVASTSGKVYIKGNSGVAVAYGFYFYTKSFCGCHISWAGDQFQLPITFPEVPLIVKTANDRFQFYQNVCTSSYSFVWWTWDRWEVEIDWMAMQGINLALAFTAQESIWQKVYLDMGFYQSELDSFFSGPAFLAWARMGNLRKWGGPLPQSWHANQMKLQNLILNRMRNLGMVPVLPAFSGFVPSSIKRLYPNVNVTQSSAWGHFNSTYTQVNLLEPTDKLFQEIGTRYLKKYISYFGTNHVYAADTFNEMAPRSGDLNYLANVGASIYEYMNHVDPDSIWIMQGWLFLENFWSEDRAKALLHSVPLGSLVILDLYSECRPQFLRLKSYFGVPWIWCMLHDFGGNLGLFGDLDAINTGPFNARSINASTMVGIGMTPEGIFQNNVIYEFMAENSWRSKPRNISEWLSGYSLQRYGKHNSDIVDGWIWLKKSMYTNRGGYGHMHSPITGRPSLDPIISKDHCYSKIIDDSKYIMNAWDSLLLAVEDFQFSPLYRYDLVDVTRQVLQIIGTQYAVNLTQAAKNNDIKEFRLQAKNMLKLLLNMDALLNTDEHFLLGKWLGDAKRLANNSYEEKLYEYNARNQITLWGPTGNIRDYASKQWAGLIKDFYYERWNLFIDQLDNALSKNITFNLKQFYSDAFHYIEEPFTFSNYIYNETPKGNSIDVVRIIYEMYRNETIFAFKTIMEDSVFSYEQ